MNTEERQLAEMLHRVTPEPPRRVTVEDVAFRVASEPRREPRSRAAGLSGASGGAGRQCWPRSACSPSPGPARASPPWRPRTTAVRRRRAAGGDDGRPDVGLAVPDLTVAVDIGRAAAAGGRRDVGRRADQPRVVHARAR